MKKTILIILTLTISFYSLAQDNPKQKEVGLVISSFNNFGLTYRMGNPKSLWRFTALLVNGGHSSRSLDSLLEESTGFGAGFLVGREFRKNITENFEIRYGLDIGFDFNNSHQLRVDDTSRDLDIDITNNSYAPRINLMIGFNYIIKDNFIIGAEILPHFTYSYHVTKKYNAALNETNKTDRNGYSYGFNSNSAQLTFLYRF